MELIDWQLLYHNAEKYHLDLQRFKELEPFFKTMDPELFATCVNRVMKNFPLYELKTAMPEEELVKMLLLCIVANYDNMEALYKEKGWPRESLQEISNDLNVWTSSLLRDLGEYGLTPRIFHWEQECLKGDVKQFGRLQCNDITTFEPNLSVYRTGNNLQVCKAFCPGNPRNPDLTYGDHVINLHIPASGPLDVNECWKSLRRMDAFNNQFHPDYDYKAFVCYSWLLDPQFQQILPANSNILQFQQMGHLFTLERSQTEEVRWRIWGEDGKVFPLEKLSEKTSMERGVKKFLQEGGEFREGCMIIFKDEVKPE